MLATCASDRTNEVTGSFESLSALGHSFPCVLYLLDYLQDGLLPDYVMYVY